MNNYIKSYKIKEIFGTVGTVLKPLQIGEIMSNNEIMQFSYFYWKSNDKKADEKMTLFPDGICHLLQYCVMLLENVSQDTIRSLSGLWTFELILFDCFR